MGVLATPINNLANGFNNFVSGIGEFFGNLLDSLGSWFEYIGEFFSNLISSLGTWFEGIMTGISSLGNDIGSWFQGVLDNITQFAIDFNNKMLNILSYLDPTSENFFLKLAFIPHEGYFTSYFDDIMTTFDEKLPFIGKISGVINEIKDLAVSETSPEFKVTLPGGKWGSGDVSIFNYSILEPYRQTIKSLISVFLWIPFIIRQYKRIPKIIY